MSMLWYPDGFEIAVDNPGHGQVWISADRDHGDWDVHLAGAHLGTLLDAVTYLALAQGPEGGRSEWSLVPVAGLPGPISRSTALRLLRPIQSAILLAIGGTDRFERTYPDVEDSPPVPLCVRCDEGSFYSDAVSISAWCAQYGHSPYGEADRTTWEAAGRLHAQRKEWHDRRKKWAREDAELGARLKG